MLVAVLLLIACSLSLPLADDLANCPHTNHQERSQHNLTTRQTACCCGGVVVTALRPSSHPFLTHLGNVSSCTAEINESHIHKVRAVAHSDRLLLQRVHRAHRHDLSQLHVLREQKRNGNQLSYLESRVGRFLCQLLVDVVAISVVLSILK